jgi:hypothetical protein
MIGVFGVEIGIYYKSGRSSNIGTGVNRELIGSCDSFSDIDISAGD